MQKVICRKTKPMQLEKSSNNTISSWRLFEENLITAQKNAYWSIHNVILKQGDKPRTIVAHPSWLRDYVHMQKGNKYLHDDIKSFLEAALELQSEKGYFFEIITIVGGPDSYHKDFVTEDHTYITPSNHMFIRLELEADIEYLVVEGVKTVWQVEEDDEWLKKQLPRLEKAIHYMLTDPKRFDDEHGLVKRPFTIDTWDFAYGQSGENRKIMPSTPMSIMHGDNSGVFQACNILAEMNAYLGYMEKAGDWRIKAQMLKDNMDKYLWNGDFYIHQLHLNHSGIEGEDETRRLSLSNAYNMNRGVTSFEQATQILREYQKRLEENKEQYFCEWYSVEPPYTQFNNFEQDQYINGGFPLFVAGELAKAAFNHGFEAYGFDILCRVKALLESRDGNMSFLYYWDGRTMKEGLARQDNWGTWGPKGWNSAAILSALYEALYGIKDGFKGYQVLEFCPRWVVTDFKEINMFEEDDIHADGIGYALSNKRVQYRYSYDEINGHMVYKLNSPSSVIQGHILLPKGATCKIIMIDQEEIPCTHILVGESSYVDFSFKQKTKENTFHNIIELTLTTI